MMNAAHCYVCAKSERVEKKRPNEKSLGEKRANQKYLTDDCHVQITENYHVGESLINNNNEMEMGRVSEL